MSILSKLGKTQKDLSRELKRYISEVFNVTDAKFSKAGAYGQIIEVLKAFYEKFMYHVRVAFRESNPLTAKWKRSVWGLARISGHIPYRGLGAKGVIRVKINKNAIVNNPDIGSKIFIAKGATLRDEDNGQIYYVDISDDVIVLDITNLNYFNIPIKEGIRNVYTNVGNGQPLQSYTIEGGSNVRISDSEITVKVNGETLNIYSDTYDMYEGEKACLIRTGYNGGIDIIFGKIGHGIIPQINDTIEVVYYVVNGEAGNKRQFETSANMVFETGIFSDLSEGRVLDDVGEVLSISMLEPPSMGSNGEDTEDTRGLIGKSSRSWVLAGVENFEHFLARYSTLRVLNIFKDNNEVKIFVVPSLKNRIYDKETYYTIPEARFKLSDAETKNITDALVNNSIRSMTVESSLIQPQLKKYVALVSITKNNTGDKTHIQEQVRELIATQMIEGKRTNFIPISDFIAEIKNISGVEAVSMSFISEQNEDAIRNGSYVETYIDQTLGVNRRLQRTVILGEDENPQLGLDNEGNILVSKNELPIIRGGFETYNDVELDQPVYVNFV